MGKFLALALCLHIVFAEAAYGGDKSDECNTVFKKISVLRAFLNYTNDVSKTKGRRLLSAPFVEKPDHKLSRKERFLIRTWGKFTETHFGRVEVPSIIAEMIALSILGYFSDKFIINPITKKLQTRARVKYIESHPSFFNFFINYDMRASNIRRRLIQGEISPPMARLEFYAQVLYPYSMWFGERENYISRPVSYFKDTLIRDNPIFHPLLQVVDLGVLPQPGFITPPEFIGPISDLQVRTLVNETDELAIRTELITRLIGAPYTLEEDIDPRLMTEERKNEIVADKFNQELRAAYAAHQISVGQLLYGMEEEEYWKIEFERFKTLHIVKLDWLPNEEQTPTNKPLTLEDIQEKIRVGLTTRAHPVLPP